MFDPFDGHYRWQRFEYVHGRFEKNVDHFYPCIYCAHGGWCPFDSLIGEEIRHAHPHMWYGLIEWAEWLVETIPNISGWRMDGVKHFCWHMARRLGDVVHGTNIGEYWCGRHGIREWMFFTGDWAFDFELRGAMRGGAYRLTRPGACLGMRKSVTYVDSHDTHENPRGPEHYLHHRQRAYGFILYSQRVPTIYWLNWFNPDYQPAIRRALAARRAHNFYGTRIIYHGPVGGDWVAFNNDGGVVGIFNSRGPCAAELEGWQGRWVYIGIGLAGATFHPIAWGGEWSDSRPGPVVLNADGWGEFWAAGGGFAYFHPAGLGAPTLSVTPDLAFGDVNVNQDRNLDFTITNTGTGTLMGRLSAPPGPFGHITGDYFALLAGESTMVTMRFGPTVVGPASAVVTFGSTGGDLTRLVSGIGITDVTPPTVTIDPVTTPTNIVTQTLTGIREAGYFVALSADNPLTTFTRVNYITATTWRSVVTLVEGTNVITVTSTDPAGNIGTATATIILDTVAPEITIAPVIIPTDVITQTIIGTMEAGAIVTLSSATATFGAVTTPTDTTWSVVATLAEGSNIIIATATDAAGNAGTATTTIVLVILKGDINNDGRVTLADIMLCVRMRFGEPVTIEGVTYSYPYPPALLGRADMNEDGRITLADIMLVVRARFGL